MKAIEVRLPFRVGEQMLVCIHMNAAAYLLGTMITASSDGTAWKCCVVVPGFNV